MLKFENRWTEVVMLMFFYYFALIYYLFNILYGWKTLLVSQHWKKVTIGTKLVTEKLIIRNKSVK